METSVVDEFYGDPSYHPDSVLNYDEESVDIYSGLEDSPKKIKSNDKDGTFISPNHVNESLDLYEELITEEQEKKDTTYNELKSKFAAAQNQVRDLLIKLQQMQTKNSSLHQENTLLKKNICALIKTAKMEIVRKDEEINKLSSRSSRGSFHPLSKIRGRDASNRSLKGSNSPACLKRDDGLSEVSQSGLLNQPSVLPSVDFPHSSSVMPRKCSGSDLQNAVNQQNKDGHCSDSLLNTSMRDHRYSQDNKTACSKESESTSKNSEMSSSRQNICVETVNRTGVKEPGRVESSSKEEVSEKNQNPKMHQPRSEREQNESAKGGCGSGNGQRQQHDDHITLRRSGHSRSPSSQLQHTSLSSFFRTNADTHSRKEEFRHKQGHERQRGHAEVYSARNEKSSLDKSYRKTEKRGTREHHRKEERRQEGMSSSERRHTRSDGIKDYEQRRTHSEESNGGERKSTKSETSKDHERQSAKDSGTTRGVGNKADKILVSDGRERSRGDIRESRRHASPVKSHHNAHNLRKDQDDKRRTSSRTEDASRSKASSSRDDSMGDTYMRSHRPSVKGRDDKEKRVKSPYNGLKNTPDNARLSKKSDDENLRAECLSSTRRKSPIKQASSCDSSSMPEDSSSNRKLSFMETLNLTISPVKKNSEQAKDQDQPRPVDIIQSSSSEGRRSFDNEEEYCIIDEVEESPTDDSLADPTTQTYEKPPLTSLNIRGKQPELPESFDEDRSKTQSGKPDGMNLEVQEKESITRADVVHSGKCPTNPAQKCVGDKFSVPEGSVHPERTVLVDSPAFPLILDADSKKQDSQTLLKTDKENRRTGAKNSHEECQIADKPKASVQNDPAHQEVTISVMATSTAQVCSNMDSSVSLDVVSSTVSLEISHQSKETIAYSDMDIMQGHESLNPYPCPGVEPIVEAMHVNNTSQEEGLPSEQVSSSEPDSTENKTVSCSRPSWSIVEPHDDDSMLLTLSNIKVIPDAISPLTSPVRQIKKSQHRLGKESHVKSLSKDFSTLAAVADKDAVKMDMNKENERPDSLVRPGVHKDQQEAIGSTSAAEEVEEGEIISESDGEGALVIQSPSYETRSSLKNQHSPRSPRLQKISKKKIPAVTPSHKECEKNTFSKDSPSSNKRRFKTITVPSKVIISTSAELMNSMIFIRSELRRKYMKLHKNVTKPAFCCIIEMSQASFIDFVDSINFHRFCNQGNEIKSQLNQIIVSVMSKVSNNGIVNRIFEQQAEDLKQKLWTFVDSQFDFLFKELKDALKAASNHSKNNSSESKQSNPRAKEDSKLDLRKLQPKEPLSTTENRPHKKFKGAIEGEGQKVLEKIPFSYNLPCGSRGIGSSSKSIKATMEEEAKVAEDLPSQQLQAVSSIQECSPTHESKASNCTSRLSHSGSTQDRADFEILTEQQTSSLTFNLVTDSQMGDIFRCLLQGSDLLETGDNQNWPPNTPQKDSQAGEILTGVLTPSKMITPLKLNTTWTSISPYQFQMPITPALLDENCMLEIPSNVLSNHAATAVATTGSQPSFSILAEDLAVSLTIPSPLKSDGHLSFLHPTSGQPLPTPSHVISAHYGEDALLGGEDATEQDIHLSLETDNSSSPSSTSGNWEDTHSAVFQFKPNLPMEAEVMERSNDHFIVRIRHTPPGTQEELERVHNETLLTADALSSHTLDQSQPLVGQHQVTSIEGSEADISSKIISSGACVDGTVAFLPKATENLIEQADDGTGAIGVTSATESEQQMKKSCHRVSRKHKKYHSGPRAKRSRREKLQEKKEEKHKKRSKSSKDENVTPSKKIKSPSPQFSPNSLSAKNVIRKKGEVVVTWSREEDRDILVALKTEGASSKTFAALASKLKKSQAQIEERFSQLMKLFKKKEKMEN